MKILKNITPKNQAVKIWLSTNDTYKWAHRSGSGWPCSYLSNKRVFAEFDRLGDLVDFAINGSVKYCPSNEFNALIADFI